VNVSLPEDLLEAIDRVSDNRSRFLAEAAREKLQHT
jgi:metal-responsive CopG/Arc/MetJ family transcriptional regulator